MGDAAYGTPKNIDGVKQRGVVSLLAKPRREHGSGLGRLRYVVERTHTWFGFNRRLRLCYEKTEAHFQAFHDLAAALICARRIHNLN
jgi:transposase